MTKLKLILCLLNSHYVPVECQTLWLGGDGLKREGEV